MIGPQAAAAEVLAKSALLLPPADVPAWLVRWPQYMAILTGVYGTWVVEGGEARDVTRAVTVEKRGV